MKLRIKEFSQGLRPPFVWGQKVIKFERYCGGKNPATNNLENTCLSFRSVIVATTPDILFSLLPSIVRSRKGDYNSKSFLLKYHICVWSSVKNSSTFKTFT